MSDAYDSIKQGLQEAIEMTDSTQKSEPSDVVERAKEALEGTTPGEWTCYINGRSESYVDMSSGHYHTMKGPNHENDATFVAIAPTLVRELIAEIERLRNERS